MHNHLLSHQKEIVFSQISGSTFLEGSAGTGKTTTAVARLGYLLKQNIPASSILIIIPQRTLAAPYDDFLSKAAYEGGVVSRMTLGGLSKRMVELFWNLIVKEAGFLNNGQPPTFLTLETAQYIMAGVVTPLLDKGFFGSIKISRNRLYSQIIDNLNKSATIGFPCEEIGKRLIEADIGEPGKSRVYEDVQTCSTLFRQFCRQHNLLDFSLQVELFRKYLWSNPLCREYLEKSYRHLIVDNIEEDTPVTHDILREWLPGMDSSLIIYDYDAGYRRFLGADPISAYDIKKTCQKMFHFSENLVISSSLRHLNNHLSVIFQQVSVPEPLDLTKHDELLSSLEFKENQYFPDMLDWFAQEIHHIVQEGEATEEIVVLSPFLSDSLRHSLANRIEAFGIPTRSHRPSRSLKDEPVVMALLNVAFLAHPDYRFIPLSFDLMQALMIMIDDLDLVRAYLLCDSVYLINGNKNQNLINNEHDEQPLLLPFEKISSQTQERITYRIGECYEYLRQWIEKYKNKPEQALDIFFSRLFGEVLSQPGFAFHKNFNAGEITANLIESIQKFRWITSDCGLIDAKAMGLEYIKMVKEGVIASQYLRSWQDEPEVGVLMAPAYTFLLRNRPVNYQFWLDIGSHAWYERLYQPLTHPYVLSRQWNPGDRWTSDDNIKTDQAALYRLMVGLIRRCRKKIYLGFSDFSEQGDENRGSMLYTFQKILRIISQS